MSFTLLVSRGNTEEIKRSSLELVVLPGEAPFLAGIENELQEGNK